MPTRRVSVAFMLFAASEVAFASTLTGTGSAETTSMTTVKIKAAGISLRCPSTWTVIPLTKKDLAAQAKVLATKNPELAQLLVAGAQLALQSDALKLRVVNLESRLAGRLADGNVRVYVHTSGGFPSTLDEFKSKMTLSLRVAAATGSGQATILQASAVNVGGQPGYCVDLRQPQEAHDGTMTTIRTTRMSFARGHGDVSVDVTTTDDDTGAALIDDILGSVQPI
jgi:hypothetical protein